MPEKSANNPYYRARRGLGISVVSASHGQTARALLPGNRQPHAITPHDIVVWPGVPYRGEGEKEKKKKRAARRAEKGDGVGRPGATVEEKTRSIVLR